MSNAPYGNTVISKVGKALNSLLWNNIKDDPAFKGIITSERQISLLSPKEVADSKTSIKLCVFLYGITEYTVIKNTPQTVGKSQSTPLYLTLHYLFVPYTQNAEIDHVLLDKIIQLFKDNPVLPSSTSGNQELRLTMDALSTDDLNKIWTMLATPYKTSLGYSVFPVAI